MNTKYGLYVYVITRMVENHTLGRDLTWISFAVAYGMTPVWQHLFNVFNQKGRMVEPVFFQLNTGPMSEYGLVML